VCLKRDVALAAPPALISVILVGLLRIFRLVYVYSICVYCG